MTPKLQGLAEAMKKLEHELEDGAGKVMARVEALGPRGQAALAKSHERLDAKAAIVGEIEGFVTTLEGANGGDPLDDSSDTSEVKKKPETIIITSDHVGTVDSVIKPEQLTVNGVSVTQ